MTTQKQVRAAVWEAWRTGMFKGLDVTPKRIKNYSGNGTMHNTDTRVAFCDFVDHLSKSGTITSELAERVTL